MSKGSGRALLLSQHMDKLVEKLHQLAPRALHHFEEKAIHDARVATRRLKAALDLLEPALAPEQRKPFNRALRKLRRRLGPLRDLDVMIEHLGALSGAAMYSRAVEWLSERLMQEREMLRQRLGRKARAAVPSGLGRWQCVRKQLVALENELTPLLAKSLDEQLRAFEKCAGRLKSATRRLTEGAEGAEGAEGGEEAEDPHALRIAGKRLRYTLELAVATGHALPPTHLKTFKRLQDALGLWHDYVVLMQGAMRAAADADLAAHDRERHRQLLKLISSASGQSERHLGRFVTLWAQHGRVLARDIRQVAASPGRGRGSTLLFAAKPDGSPKDAAE